MPKEAAMITVLALADMYAAAQVARGPWTLLLGNPRARIGTTHAHPPVPA